MHDVKIDMSCLERCIAIVDGLRWSIEMTQTPDDLDGLGAVIRATVPAARALLETVGLTVASEHVSAAADALAALGWIASRVSADDDFDPAVSLCCVAIEHGIDSLELALDALQAPCVVAPTDRDSLRSDAIEDSSLEREANVSS